MRHYTPDQMRSIEDTANRLCSAAYSLCSRDSKQYANALALNEIIARVRQAADVMEHDPEAAELLLLSIVRPLQTA